MNNDQAVGTFAINAIQESMLDIFDLEIVLDNLVDALDKSTSDPLVWKSVNDIRDILDDLRYRSLVSPSYIRQFVPDTHLAIIA